MRVSVLFATLAAAFVLWMVLAVQALRADPPIVAAPQSSAAAGVASVPSRPSAGVKDLIVAELRARLEAEHARYLQARRLLHRRWRPTVQYAIRLASAVTGVPAWELYAVGRCESGLYPFARNGRYRGVFQLGWAPFGLDPFDPLANTLSAALTVQRDGGWRQWECKP